MEVKGVAFLSRKEGIIKQFGKEKWEEFIKKISTEESYFKQPILASTLIPVQSFLIFQDVLLKEFYNNNEQVYWMIGEKSAEWSLLEGPYKTFLKTKDLNKFVESSLPLLWKMFYSSGIVYTKLDNNNIAHIKILDLPIWHIHFEYTIMGYCKRAFELLGIENLIMNKIKGVSLGDKEIYYQFKIG